MASVSRHQDTGELRPADLDEARDILARSSGAGRGVRIVGSGTKLHWGRAAAECEVRLSTRGLNAIRAHNAGDLTAVLEAGVPLAEAQAAFAASGQMLALDPWLGLDSQATVGGVLATGDAGPLAHRYGPPRDLVLGMTVVLSDGTVARSGGQVIKNVAGYDVAKLFCGSFGTLGLIAQVNVRLHPRPESTATAIGHSPQPGVVARAAAALAGAPLELEAFDVAWEDERGTVLARCGGSTAQERAERTATAMRQAGLGETAVSDPDEELWEGQRAGQRSPTGVVLRVAARPGALAELLAAARSSGARLIGRAALGLSYLTVDQDALESLLGALPAGSAWSVQDAPLEMRSTIEPWGPAAPEAVQELMGRVKARFDPSRTCNPGLFVGGI